MTCCDYNCTQYRHFFCAIMVLTDMPMYILVTFSSSNSDYCFLHCDIIGVVNISQHYNSQYNFWSVSFNGAINCWDYIWSVVDKWISIEYWWIETDWEKPQYPYTNLYQCHFGHQKSHINQSGIKPVLPWQEACKMLCQPWHNPTQKWQSQYSENLKNLCVSAQLERCSILHDIPSRL
jgi:hypothetical protein